MNDKPTKGAGSAISRTLILSLLVFTPLARGAVPPWAVTVILLVTLAGITALLLDWCLAWQWAWPRSALDRPILCLVILGIASFVFSVHRYTSWWALLLFLGYLAVYYLVIATIDTPLKMRRLVYLVVALAVFLSVFGLVKKTGANVFSWWDYATLNLNPDAARSSSTFGNPNHFAGYLVMTIPLVLGLFMWADTGANRILFLGLAILLMVSLALSTSRGGWVSATAVLLFMGAFRARAIRYNARKWMLAFFPAAVILALVVLESRSIVLDIRSFFQASSDSSVLSRIAVWQGIFAMVADYPLLGVGPGNFSLIFTQYQPPMGRFRYLHAHNDYLHLVAELGLPLVPIMGWGMVRFYRAGIAKLRHPDRFVRRITLGAMAAVTGILVFSLADFNLHIPANALLFTVLVALTVSPAPGSEKP